MSIISGITKWKKTFQVIALVGFITVFVYVFYDQHENKLEIIYQGQNDYGEFEVYESNHRRCLSFDKQLKAEQSCILTNHIDRLVHNYAKFMLGSLYMSDSIPKRVLVIGLGGGVLPRTLLKLYPDMYMDIVEIDHDMIDVAKQYFSFHPSEHTNIFIEDAFQYVHRLLSQKKKYDLILLDASQRDVGIPFSFRTLEFVEALKNIMSGNGVIAANLVDHVSSDNHQELRGLYQQVFGSLFYFDDSKIVLAKKGDVPSMEKIKNNDEKLKDELRVFSISEQFLLSKLIMLSPNTTTTDLKSDVSHQVVVDD